MDTIRKRAKTKIRINHLSISFLFLLSFYLFSCGKKEEKKESPAFTKEDPSYTADYSTEEINTIKFTDITEEAGIEFQHVTGAFGKKWMPETIGSGGGFLDYNMDGLVDIFLVNSTEWSGHETDRPRPTSRLYENQGDGTFKDVSKEAGINFPLYGMGSYFADFDADGDMDIYLTAVGDNKLLRNDNGKFVDITPIARVNGNDPTPNTPPAWSTSATWVDVDRDGWLDLFVANYVKWTPQKDIYTTRDGKTKSYATPDVYKGESCRLYRNIEGKYFEDITEKAGVLNHEGKSLGVAIADFNDDNYPDIVVSNDTQPNFLYINNGDGTFENKAVSAGVGYDESGRARAGMGVDVADINNDGGFSIAIGNFSHEPVSLYTQIGDGDIFQDLAGKAQLTRTSLLPLTFGLQFLDINLDGYLDLVMANGHIEPEINSVEQDVTFEQRPQIFYNDSGRFIDITNEAGPAFSQPMVGRGLASADIDQDGDLDLLITVNGGSPRLLRNDLKDSTNYVRIQLKGKKPNWQAIGAKIIVWSEGTQQIRMVRTGSSYLSQSDIGTTIIGLDNHEQADSIIVQWPTSGKITKLVNKPANETYVIEEGSNPIL